MEGIDLEKTFLDAATDALRNLQGQVTPQDVENLEYLAQDMPKLLIAKMQGKDVEREIGFNRASLAHYSSAAQKVVIDTFIETVKDVALKLGAAILGSL